MASFIESKILWLGYEKGNPSADERGGNMSLKKAIEVLEEEMKNIPEWLRSIYRRNDKLEKRLREERRLQRETSK